MSLHRKAEAVSLAGMSRLSPETIAIIAVGELRGDMQDVRERLARLEGAILARHEPSSEVSGG